jgi:hypothetical protein
MQPIHETHIGVNSEIGVTHKADADSYKKNAGNAQYCFYIIFPAKIFLKNHFILSKVYGIRRMDDCKGVEITICHTAMDKVWFTKKISQCRLYRNFTEY